MMPRYRIAGGPDGTAGINYKNTRAEVDDVVDDIPRESVKWLRDQGYIEIVGKDGTPIDDPTPSEPVADQVPTEEVAP